jgi:hypothetical protein
MISAKVSETKKEYHNIKIIGRTDMYPKSLQFREKYRKEE